MIQSPPELPDAWQSDRLLRESLRFILGNQLWAAADPLACELASRLASPSIRALASRAETDLPQHVAFTAWGSRIDEIRVSDAYVQMGRIAVDAGLTALPHEREPFGERARVVQAALLYLWAPASAGYACPIGMTDAAARTLLDHGGELERPVVDRLVSRDPDRAWTCGQWMTEWAGGSDVGGTETTARLDRTGVWRLHGVKSMASGWPTDIALALARPAGAPDGARGLALFWLPAKVPDGTPNGIRVRRLRDKLGTRPLPTAELELDGSWAHPLGDPHDGGGVRRIATQLTITRIGNSVGAAAALARGLALARSFGRVRRTFGRALHEWPGYRTVLADLAIDGAAALALSLRCAELLGRAEHGTASSKERELLRGLVPITKLATAKWAVAGMTEAMECLGGFGYCEDSGVPAILRDTHVLPIWEGTTNVLALDFLRAAAKGAIEAMFEDLLEQADSIASQPAAAEAAVAIRLAVDELRARAADMASDSDIAQVSARSFALGLAWTAACARLAVQGSWAASRGDPRTARVAVALARRGLVPPRPTEDGGFAVDD